MGSALGEGKLCAFRLDSRGRPYSSRSTESRLFKPWLLNKVCREPLPRGGEGRAGLWCGAPAYTVQLIEPGAHA